MNTGAGLKLVAGQAPMAAEVAAGGGGYTAHDGLDYIPAGGADAVATVRIITFSASFSVSRRSRWHIIDATGFGFKPTVCNTSYTRGNEFLTST
jgi:hypothetical protein